MINNQNETDNSQNAGSNRRVSYQPNSDTGNDWGAYRTNPNAESNRRIASQPNQNAGGGQGAYRTNPNVGSNRRIVSQPNQNAGEGQGAYRTNPNVGSNRRMASQPNQNAGEGQGAYWTNPNVGSNRRMASQPNQNAGGGQGAYRTNPNVGSNRRMASQPNRNTGNYQGNGYQENWNPNESDNWNGWDIPQKNYNSNRTAGNEQESIWKKLQNFFIGKSNSSQEWVEQGWVDREENIVYTDGPWENSWDGEQTEELYDDDIGETEEINDEILTPPGKIFSPWLVRMKTNERIMLCTSGIFKIGRNYDNDYIVKDNGRISRHHAEIIVDSRKWVCILRVGENRNGVSIDSGENLPIGSETLLQDGCKIRLVDEVFEFHAES